MIADRTYRAVSFLAFSGRTSEKPLALCGALRPQSEAGTGAPGAGSFGCGAGEQTVSDGS